MPQPLDAAVVRRTRYRFFEPSLLGEFTEPGYGLVRGEVTGYLRGVATRRHPISDACDFARFCSQLDFWSLNDHAEGLTPDIWSKTKKAICQCNAIADTENPDVVAFLGYEWTQAGTTPANHYGHKNVVFRDLAEEDIPTHPVAAANPGAGPRAMGTPMSLRAVSWLLDPTQPQRFFDYNRYIGNAEAVKRCPAVPYAELPRDCIPFVATPAGLFSLLRQWGIPHGNAWGLYTPPGSTWGKQLRGAMHDPKRQILVELFSGHGNSEEYRSWRETVMDENGAPHCPADRLGHTTGCQRAGEIIAQRCKAAELGADECAKRVREARELFAQSGAMNFATVPGTSAGDWRDSEQCTNCYLPTFRHRPGGSTQYAMAVRNFDHPGAPRRFDFGFIGSSDNHRARPGTGYKEVDRTHMTDSGPGVSALARAIIVKNEAPLPNSRPLPPLGQRHLVGRTGITLLERTNSFFFTGGLVAVHSEGRNREAIWDALERREVYATSGRRTLLWFDLIDGEDDLLAMGGRIERIEVVRIRPQAFPGEPVDGLIEDACRTFECPADGSGCTVEFNDPDFVASGRDALYYVRAIEAAIPTINGRTLRVERDGGGDFVSMQPCNSSRRNDDRDDDCLAPQHPMAWSSPIFVACERGPSP